MLLTPAQIKPKSFESRRNSFLFFFTGGGCASFPCVLGARFCFHHLSEGADRGAGQLRGDKEWRNEIWQSLEEGAVKRCSECASWAHSEHRFPAPSSKLPDLVTPLKGHSLSPRSCPPTRSASSERFGY